MSYASGQSVAVTKKCSKVPAQRVRARVRALCRRLPGRRVVGRRVAGDGDCHGTAAGRAGLGLCTIASMQACCGETGSATSTPPGVRDWDKDHPPDPGDLADAVRRVADSLPAYRKAARQRAVDRFDQKAWVDRHCEVFEELLDR